MDASVTTLSAVRLPAILKSKSAFWIAMFIGAALRIYCVVFTSGTGDREDWQDHALFLLLPDNRWFFCGNGWLLGNWDFVGRPNLPLHVLLIRDIAVSFFFVSACVFLVAAFRREPILTRATDPKGNSDQ